MEGSACYSARVSDRPPEDPWGSPGSGSQYPPPPPPPPGGGHGYPPPPPGQGYPPPPQQGGYPPPPPGQGYGYPPPPGPYGGYPQPGGYDYGPVKGMTPYGQATGWWRRVGATLIDGVVLIIPNFIVDAIGGRGVGTLLSLLISGTYITVMLSRSGQTVGNMAVGTRVIDSSTGGPVSVGKALGRWASELVLAVLFLIPLLLDFLWPLWDRQNQTLHDKIAGTLVILTN